MPRNLLITLLTPSVCFFPVVCTISPIPIPAHTVTFPNGRQSSLIPWRAQATNCRYILWWISLSQKFPTKLKSQTLSRFSFSGVNAAFQGWVGGIRLSLQRCVGGGRYYSCFRGLCCFTIPFVLGLGWKALFPVLSVQGNCACSQDGPWAAVYHLRPAFGCYHFSNFALWNCPFLENVENRLTPSKTGTVPRHCRESTGGCPWADDPNQSVKIFQKKPSSSAAL